MLDDTPELLINLILKDFSKEKNLNVIVELGYRLHYRILHVLADLLEPVSLNQVSIQMLGHGLVATALRVTLAVVLLFAQHNLCNSFFELVEGQTLLVYYLLA
jgi:hypothetical protein